MNATDVIGYAYESDYHCSGCTIARFGEAEGSPPLYPWAIASATDSNGDRPAPIFGDSEWWRTDDGATFPQLLKCGTCGGTIAEVTQ